MLQITQVIYKFNYTKTNDIAKLLRLLNTSKLKIATNEIHWKSSKPTTTEVTMVGTIPPYNTNPHQVLVFEHLYTRLGESISIPLPSVQMTSCEIKTQDYIEPEEPMWKERKSTTKRDSTKHPSKDYAYMKEWRAKRKAEGKL